MAKKNRIVDTKELARLRKQVQKIDKMIETVQKLHKELDAIKESEWWLRYLSEKSIETLTDDERQELYKINEIIMYASLNQR